MSVPGSGFFFFFVIDDEDKLKFPISTEEEEQDVLTLSLQPDPSSASLFASHPNVKMRHVTMHNAALKPHRECCFFDKYRGFIYSDWSGKWGPVL